MDNVLIIKIISACLYPIGLFITLHLVAMVAHRRSFWRKIWFAFAWSVLVLASNPMIANALVKSLEGQYPPTQIDSIEAHDAVIVLGGGLRIPLPPAHVTQLASGSDRYWHAAQLYKAGKAKNIWLTGGNAFPQAGFQGESYYASKLLQAWGVPASAIKSETASRTTEQNRLNIEDWAMTFELESAYLVTSGYHMPRAMLIFEDFPLFLSPSAADIIVRDTTRPLILQILPSALALSLSTMAVHEYLGIMFLRMRRMLNLS